MKADSMQADEDSLLRQIRQATETLNYGLGR